MKFKKLVILSMAIVSMMIFTQSAFASSAELCVVDPTIWACRNKN